MKIALAQCNPIVGDIAGNTARMADCIDRAAAGGADLVVFGELSVVGYPPRDLLRKERFIADTQRAVDALARRCTRVAALVGYVRSTPEAQGRPLQNVAGLLQNGRVAHVHVKTLLPTYDVFDETRYFQPGPPPRCFELHGVRIGLSICEDLWDAEALGRALYGQDPIELLVGDGAQVIVNMAASPFQVGKGQLREDLFRRRARRTRLPVIYVNQVGGNDELVFDGASCVVGPEGQVLARAATFQEDLVVVDLDGGVQGGPAPAGDMAQLSAALKLGLRDYVRKCGFSSVVLGLSGGIDSAVVAVLAADALGPENVVGISMPSRYSSDHSQSDADDLARRLGIRCPRIAIEPMHRAFEAALGQALAEGNREIADENIQARIRGAVVMAFSNAFAHMPLATGNKSELSTGYCTLYGDMVGGLAPIGDVYKTQVFRLAQHLNVEAGHERINRSIITKPPSAELKPNQVDQDKLPPYDLLDAILERYIEGDQTGEQIASAGFDGEVVRRVVRMVDAAEYKRKQAAPVLKVTARAFGTGRRVPIAQRYVSVGGF
ncbi:MAG: Glutamine-dependent NAD(+) synthetase [Planctomycetes bacterium ADurb.Bin126]|nr:MAG: Glutamine-dependent NAD(+) synthetase [Planctomycetes bacterium ADurb.Bin126]HOD80912.1 NAD+ synthase [Phycisphaerae bacterium]HQL72237.1 NAD+ synthase [Phycisphaerae bacterium]